MLKWEPEVIIMPVYIPKDLEPPVCGTCANYYQHYILGVSRRFDAIWCGHCVYPRTKLRQPDDTCPNWKARKKADGQ